VATSDELLQRADALDEDASSVAVGGREAEERLRRQAGELRRQALAGRGYPTLLCDVCFHLTGWLAESGRCVFCEERRLMEEANEFLGLRDGRVATPAASGSPWRRTRRAFGLAGRRDRLRQWLSRVEPDGTGPAAPEDGWELEAPVKYDRRRPDGIGYLVCFDVQSVRFEYSEWRNIATTPGGKPRVIGPREFAASLPMEQLAEAWVDFEEEVARHNERIWRAERERREQERRLAAEQQAAEEVERGTSELLG
jgi:hypothetical protein